MKDCDCVKTLCLTNKDPEDVIKNKDGIKKYNKKEENKIL